MTARSRRTVLALLCALSAWPAVAWQSDAPPAPTTQSFDPTHTRFGFELRTRWGQKVVGVFPKYEGEVTELVDGRHQVRIVLHTAAVIVAGSDRYTAISRGPGFFDAERYPYVEFISEPHPESLIHTGGKMRGRLSMHGVSRMETLILAPGICDRPGKDCDVVAAGSVSRSEYKLDGWQFALTDRVRFNLRVRLAGAQP